MRRLWFIPLCLALVTVVPPSIFLSAQAGVAPRKRVLAWADVRNGYQHDSISHAVATIERLGWQSGLYDTFIRTDSQLITRRPVQFPANLGIATGATPLARNLNDFDAIFFFGVREIELMPAQRADLIAFVKEDGKGFVAAHSAITSFFSWPEFGDMTSTRGISSRLECSSTTASFPARVTFLLLS
jgi:uncharacterized protein